VRCKAIVELISRFQRPYLFRVTVKGEPPHAQYRVYKIAGWTDDVVAREGLKRFEREMLHPMHILKTLL